MADDFDFTYKVAVVTGASRGIGRFIALALAKRGAAIVGTARKLDSSAGAGGTLKGTMDEIADAGGKGLAVPGEITTTRGVKTVLAAAKKEFGRIDILVNNAGVNPWTTLADTSDEQWDEMIAINVTTPFLMIREVLPIMIAQGGGRIVTISSGAGSTNPRGVMGPYAATKAAVDRLTINVAVDVREHNIAVNTWQPGILATDMNPGREAAPVDVIEESIIFLLAQDASTITGQLVRRDRFGVDWGPGITGG